MLSWESAVYSLAPVITVTANNQSMTYGGSSLPSLTYSFSGLVDGDTSAILTGAPTISTTATAYNGTAGSGSNAGIYSITSALNTLANTLGYGLTTANGTLTVNKAALTATADNQTRLYGQSNPAFTETVSGYVNGDTSAILTGSAIGSSTATTTTGVGSYTITGSTAGLGVNDGNYTFAAANGQLTINKAHLTVTADNQSMTYGAGSLPTLTDTITGFVNGENAGSAGLTGGPSLSTAATAYNGTAGSGSNAGTYTITAAANNLAAANYDFAYANGTLTVNKAVLTAIADDKNMSYGAALPSLTYQYRRTCNRPPWSRAGLTLRPHGDEPTGSTRRRWPRRTGRKLGDVVRLSPSRLPASGGLRDLVLQLAPAFLGRGQLLGQPPREVPVVAGEDDRALVVQQRFDEGIDGIDVEVVPRLVEDQHVVVAQQQARQAEAGALPAGEDGDRLPDVRPPEQESASDLKNLLVLLAKGGLTPQVFEDRPPLREAGIDVLGVDADVAAVAPADVPRQRLERLHHRPQECRLPLAVVADNGRPRAVVDLQANVGGDLAVGISSTAHPDRRCLPMPSANQACFMSEKRVRFSDKRKQSHDDRPDADF
jgi:hypothetical protein